MKDVWGCIPTSAAWQIVTHHNKAYGAFPAGHSFVHDTIGLNMWFDRLETYK